MNPLMSLFSKNQVGRIDVRWEDLTKEELRRVRQEQARLERTAQTRPEDLMDGMMPGRRYPRGGAKRPAHFRGRTKLGLPPFRASTFTYSTAYPFVSSASLGHEGSYVGQDVNGGGAFQFDPWVWYEHGIITGTAMVVQGAVGTGKSSLAKSVTARSALLGRKVTVMSDVKNEWGRVARWLCDPDMEPVISVGPGMKARMNPLDEGVRPTTLPDGSPMTDERWVQTVRTRRTKLLGALLSILMVREMTPLEHQAVTFALEQAVRRVERSGQQPTIIDVIEALRNPEKQYQHLIGEDGRSVAAALSRCVHGDLEGMFDGQSTVTLNADAPMTVINTQPLESSPQEAKRIAAACTSSWVEALLTNRDGGKRWLIYEESWDLMSDIGSLERMVSQEKLAREYGIANMYIFHKSDDLKFSGDQGTRASALAESLFSDAEIRVSYRQQVDQRESARKRFGLTDAEMNRISKLGKGVGLWKVGQRSYEVRNVLTAAEVPIFNTDQQMISTQGTRGL